ncbi:hypothetical protein HAX54_022763 [Datura stramonium]|uniref:Uncharacterized protein n=1 Tax=Datura stramonium TaxID=4076 RepID=A0ABS8S4J3_DATST|nr:hypothetical protein [Datura stramonium]
MTNWSLSRHQMKAAASGWCALHLSDGRSSDLFSPLLHLSVSGGGEQLLLLLRRAMVEGSAGLGDTCMDFRRTPLSPAFFFSSSSSSSQKEYQLPPSVPVLFPCLNYLSSSDVLTSLTLPLNPSRKCQQKFINQENNYSKKLQHPREGNTFSKSKRPCSSLHFSIMDFQSQESLVFLLHYLWQIREGMSKLGNFLHRGIDHQPCLAKDSAKVTRVIPESFSLNTLETKYKWKFDK